MACIQEMDLEFEPILKPVETLYQSYLMCHVGLSTIANCHGDFN